MDIKSIKELIKMVDESNLSEVRIEDGEFKLTIRTNTFNDGKMPIQQVVSMPAPVVAAAPAATPAAAPVAPKAEAPVAAAPVAPAGPKTVEVKSPMVGTFYRSAGPGKPAFVGVGDTIEKGKPVCIIEAMKLFNEVESEITGRIVKVLVDDATPVEYDQPLFLVEI